MVHRAAGKRPRGVRARGTWPVVAVCAACAAFSSTCKDSTQPNPRQALLEVVSGNAQMGRVGEALPQPLILRIHDQDGQGAPGLSLTFTTPDSGSFSPATALTGADGTASTTWTLGPRAIAQRATAMVFGSIYPTSLTATAKPGPAVTARLARDSLLLTALGDTARAGITFADRFGNAVPAAGAAWTSSDPAIAAVSTDGLVTARAAGRTTLVARLDNATGQTPVVVRQLAARLTLVPRDTTLRSLGDTATLVAGAYDSGSSPILPLPALTWTPSDTSLVALRGPGLAVARANGAVWVLARVTGTSVADSARITVNQTPVSVTLTPDPLVLTSLGGTGTLRAKVVDARGNDYVGPIAFRSQDSTIATVSATGTVTAGVVGTTRVAATAGSVSGTAVVTVRQDIAHVILTPHAATLVALGRTVQLLWVVQDGGGNTIPGASVAFRSLDPARVSVSGAGLVTALSGGPGRIEAQSPGGPADTALVTVLQVPATVQVSPSSLTLHSLTQTGLLTPVVRDSGGTVIPGAGVSWQSGAPATVGVNGTGTVTAGAVGGPVTITATSGPASGTATVTVQQVPGSVSVAPGTLTLLTLGRTSDLGATVRDTLGSFIPGAAVSWSSSDSAVADVGPTGTVTAVSRGGPVTITATSAPAAGTAVVDVQGPPTALADSSATGSAPGSAFHTALNAALAPGGATPGLLANDDLGYPAAQVASFGALQTNDGSGSGALGAAVGTVASNAAGAVVSPLPGYADGSLTVGADGGFTFTPPANYTGTFRFAYRLGNAQGSSDAVVTLNVGMRPSALADTYPETMLGNVTLHTATGTPYSVTGNDAGDRLALQLSGSPTGGAVVLGGDGTFTFTPDAGFSGTGTFAYRIANGFGTAGPVTVSIPVSTSRIWFVDRAAAVSGDGRQGSPFRDVTDLAAVNDGAAGHPQDGDVIFLYQNATSYLGPLTLRNGQKLVGQDATISLAAATGLTPAAHQTLPAMSPADGTTTTLAGGATTLTLNSGSTGNDLRGFTLGNATVTALFGASFGTLSVGDVAIASNVQALDLMDGTVSGAFSSVTSTGGSYNVSLFGLATTDTVSLGSGALTGATVAAFRAFGGNGSFRYDGPITVTSGRALDVSGRSGGSLQLTGDITASGALPVIIDDNGGGSSVTLSGANVTLTPLSAENGVLLLDDRGSTTSFTGGHLTIVTNGANGIDAYDGGGITVSGASNSVTTAQGSAIHVDNGSVSSVVSLRFRSVSASGGASGIMVRRLGVGGGITVTGDGATPGSGGTIQNSIGGDVYAHDFENGTGIWLFSVEHAAFAFMDVRDHPNYAVHGESVVDLTMDHVRVTGTNGDNSLAGEGAVVVNDLYGTNAITHSFIGGGAANNLVVNNRMAPVSLTLSYDTIQDNGAIAGSHGLQVIASQTANLTVAVDHTLFAGNRASAIYGSASQTGVLGLTALANTFVASATNHGRRAITLDARDASQLTFDLTGNDVGTTGGVRQPLDSTGIAIAARNASVATGYVRGNHIWNGGAGSSGQGIYLLADDTANVRANVDGNTVDNVADDYGLLAEASGADTQTPPAGTGTLSLGLTNNTVNVLSGARDAMQVRQLHNNRVCGAISGNGSTTTGATYAGLAVTQANAGTFSIAGLVPPVATFLTSANPGVTNGIGTSGTFTAVAAGACNIP